MNPQKQITYNDESEMELGFIQIKSTFESNNPKCPIISYGLAETTNEQATQSILSRAIVMYEKVPGSGEISVKFDFMRMYD